MLAVLVDKQNDYHELFDQLKRFDIDYQTFHRVSRLQRHLEINGKPQGLVVDCETAYFQDFMIRFSLRYPELPVLILKQQSNDQTLLRLRNFIFRLTDLELDIASIRLLLVDDSKTVLANYSKLLENEGYSVDCASTPEQGALLAANNDYQLAILDYFMPGQTGAQLCQHLVKSEQTAELTCAILTAQYKQEVVDECLIAGAKEVMFKNESSSLFLNRIEALLSAVSKKRQIEKERARLIGLLYSVVEGVYGVGEDGRIQFVNPATLRLLGRPMVDLMGRFPHEVIHPVDNRGQATSFDHCFLQQAYMLGDELKEWRTLFVRSDGSLFPVECNVTRLGEEQQNPGSVVVFRDISEQQRLEENWQWQLNHDQLTGLLNRRAFEDLVSKELNRIRRSAESAALLFIDLDRFKQINDELGHAAGDLLLTNLSEQLSSRARSTDHVGRLSGDEFVVLLSAVTNDDIAEMAEQYRVLLEETQLFWQGENYRVTGSIGVCMLDKYCDSVAEVIARADQACQKAKQTGRNQWQIYQQNSAQISEQGNWHNRLKEALRDRQFVLLRQPVFDADTSAVIIGESYWLRLQEGERLIAPATFMSNAKRFGVLPRIDELVLQQLLDSNQVHQNDGRWVSLSLSVDVLTDEDFRKSLVQARQEIGLHASGLRIEIGEEDLYRFPKWKLHLAELREAGIGINLTHFGMNSQSILSLPELPVDAIKLDTSLTSELGSSRARSHLIDAIIRTARESRIKVIATHIESEKELELVQAREVDAVQGFFLQRPGRIND